MSENSENESGTRTYVFFPRAGTEPIRIPFRPRPENALMEQDPPAPEQQEAAEQVAAAGQQAAAAGQQPTQTEASTWPSGRPFIFQWSTATAGRRCLTAHDEWMLLRMSDRLDEVMRQQLNLRHQQATAAAQLDIVAREAHTIAHDLTRLRSAEETPSDDRESSRDRSPLRRRHF